MAIIERIHSISTDSCFPNPDQQRKHFKNVQELASSIAQEGQQSAGEVIKIEATAEAEELLAKYYSLDKNLDSVHADARDRLQTAVDAALARKKRTDLLLQPIYMIIAGERRYRACLIAGVDYKAVVKSGLDAQEVQRRAFMENINRENLTFTEEAHGLLDAAIAAGNNPFMENDPDAYGRAAAYLVSTFSKSNIWVNDRLRYFMLTKYAQSQAELGVLSVHMIYHLSRMESDLQNELVDKVVNGNIATNAQFDAAKRLIENPPAKQIAAFDPSEYTISEIDAFRTAHKAEFEALRTTLQKFEGDSRERGWSLMTDAELQYLALLADDIRAAAVRIRDKKIPDYQLAKHLSD